MKPIRLAKPNDEEKDLMFASEDIKIGQICVLDETVTGIKVVDGTYKIDRKEV